LRRRRTPPFAEANSIDTCFRTTGTGAGEVLEEEEEEEGAGGGPFHFSWSSVWCYLQRYGLALLILSSVVAVIVVLAVRPRG